MDETDCEFRSPVYFSRSDDACDNAAFTGTSSWRTQLFTFQGAFFRASHTGPVECRVETSCKGRDCIRTPSPVNALSWQTGGNPSPFLLGLDQPPHGPILPAFEEDLRP